MQDVLIRFANCSQQTIRPLTNTLGGIAGGEKYVVANLLFKVRASYAS